MNYLPNRRFYDSLLVVMFILIASNSCNDKSSKADYLNSLCTTSHNSKSDSVREYWATYLKGLHDYIGIKNISNPTDTFFFRIEYRDNKFYKIFEYSLFNLIPSHKIYVFPIEEDRSGTVLFDKNKDDLKYYSKSINASKDVDFFISLKDNKILELPSSEQIKGYPASDYSHVYLIEYSYRCKYSALLFKNPYENSNKFKQAKSLSNFLNFLKAEYKF